MLKSLFIKLPKGYKGTIETDGSTVHSVVIKGTIDYTMPLNKEIKKLNEGSYFGSTNPTIHSITNNSQQ